MWDPSTDRVVRVAKDDTLPLGARLLFPTDLRCRENSQNTRDPTSRALRAPPDKALAKLGKSLKKAILLDMPRYFVLNKPAGIAVQRGSKVNISIDDLLPQLLHGGEVSPRADQWLDMPRLVHRLDKHVTGALIIAKGADNAALLAKIFQNATKGVIEKEYWAIVCAGPSSNLHKRSQTEITMIQAPIQHGKHETMAITRVAKIKSSPNGNFCLLRLEPITGRKHQIRIHCARDLNAPIVGDDRYGEIRSSYQRQILQSFGKTKPLFLHCRSLSIRLPGHAPVRVVAPFPETWIQVSTIFGWNLP